MNGNGMITTGTISIGSAGTESDGWSPHIWIRAVETKAGWVGQVLLGDRIVWESHPDTFTGCEEHRRSRAEALAVARRRVETRLREVLG